MISWKSGNVLKFKDFESYNKLRKSKVKREFVIPGKLNKESNAVRRSFNGRKSMNLTREDHFKMSHDELQVKFYIWPNTSIV